MSIATLAAGFMICLFASAIAGLAIGRIITRADARLTQHDCENQAECDGRVEQFHALRTGLDQDQNHA